MKTRSTSEQSTLFAAILSGISIAVILTTAAQVGGEARSSGRAERVIARPVIIQNRPPLWLRIKRFVNAPYCMPAMSAPEASVRSI